MFNRAAVFDRKILEALNSGATLEEVERLSYKERWRDHKFTFQAYHSKGSLAATEIGLRYKDCPLLVLRTGVSSSGRGYTLNTLLFGFHIGWTGDGTGDDYVYPAWLGFWPMWGRRPGQLLYRFNRVFGTPKFVG